MWNLQLIPTLLQIDIPLLIKHPLEPLEKIKVVLIFAFYEFIDVDVACKTDL